MSKIEKLLAPLVQKLTRWAWREELSGCGLTWKELALQMSEVSWWCHNCGGSFQHGDLTQPHFFSIVMSSEGGEGSRCFHAATPDEVHRKAFQWYVLNPLTD